MVPETMVPETAVPIGVMKEIAEKPFLRSNAGAPKAPASYLLVQDEYGITLSVTVNATPFYDSEVPSGTYHEGLWAYDCAELWLATPVADRYIEFNLAPNGAWWTMIFTDPFKRDLTLDPPQCQTTSNVQAESWSASIIVTWDEVERALGTRNPIGNITLVLGGCADAEIPPENLHSVVTLGEPQPAFHRPWDWVTLEKLADL